MLSVDELAFHANKTTQNLKTKAEKIEKLTNDRELENTGCVSTL